MERSARGFDRLALICDGLADFAFAGQIHRSQTLFLRKIPHTGRALVVGGGSGRFLSALLATRRVAQAVGIDASQAMTRLTAARLRDQGHLGRAELRVGGLEQLDPRERFDLVVTHCFLDLFDESELVGVVAQLEAALASGGLWMFSDFAVGGGGLPRMARRSLVAALYAFFRATCGITACRLPNFDRAFEEAGLGRLRHQESACRLLRTAIYRKPTSAGARLHPRIEAPAIGRLPVRGEIPGSFQFDMTSMTHRGAPSG